MAYCLFSGASPFHILLPALQRILNTVAQRGLINVYYVQFSYQYQPSIPNSFPCCKEQTRAIKDPSITACCVLFLSQHDELFWNLDLLLQGKLVLRRSISLPTYLRFLKPWHIFMFHLCLKTQVRVENSVQLNRVLLWAQIFVCKEEHLPHTHKEILISYSCLIRPGPGRHLKICKIFLVMTKGKGTMERG